MKQDIDAIFGNVNTTPLDLSAFDKDSIDGLESKRLAKIRENETDPLIQSLEESIHINESTKKNMIRLAHLYLEDMKDNMLRDQFELADKYPDTNADEWTTFLMDRVVSTYNNKHKNALLKVRAEMNLADPYAKNKRDNLTLLQRLDDKEKESKQDVVIIRIPNKYGDDDSD